MTEGWTTPYWTSQEKVGASDGEGPGGLWGDHTEPRDCDVTCEVKCMGSHVTWGNRGTERLSDWPNAAQLVSGGGLVCVTLMPLLAAACHSEPRLQDQRPKFTPLPHNGPLAPHAVGKKIVRSAHLYPIHGAPAPSVTECPRSSPPPSHEDHPAEFPGPQELPASSTTFSKEAPIPVCL